MIQIIGAGAIGCLWLGKLKKAGIACHLVSRSSNSSTVLTFHEAQSTSYQFNISLSNHLLDTNNANEPSTILVCVKVHQVVDALQQQKPFITSGQPIILMHNGYGCAEEVQKIFPGNPIISATTANASLINNPLDITQTGSGPSYFGAFTSSATHLESIITPFKMAMTDVYWCEDIKTKCWLKLAINAVINPLTAINKIKNGALSDAEYATLIEVLIIEIHSVATAEGIKLSQSQLQETIKTVIAATADNYSSMNRDIFYKRKTEIDFINGYLIKKAQQHHIDTPLLTELLYKVKELENHSQAAVNTQ